MDKKILKNQNNYNTERSIKTLSSPPSGSRVIIQLSPIIALSKYGAENVLDYFYFRENALVSHYQWHPVLLGYRPQSSLLDHGRS